MQLIIDAADSDIFDVLVYVAYTLPTITRATRAKSAKSDIDTEFTGNQQDFVDFTLGQYVTEGVDELAKDKLPALLQLKYGASITDAIEALGPPEEIQKIFTNFQRHLYQPTPYRHIACASRDPRPGT
jgi:type I restriction enzyme R subunit